MAGGVARRERGEVDERIRQLIELAPDAILIHDGERIVLANAAAVRLAGATRRGQLVGLPIDDFLDPPHLKAVQAQLTDAVSSSDLAPPVRDFFHRLDGSQVAVEVRAVAFMDGDRPSAHLVVRDITERLAAEHEAIEVKERLQQAQKMELAGTLAGGVAHEVNNTLQVISGFSDSLLADPRLPEDCLADVREITRAAHRAATVTRQLLAFSHRAVHRPETVYLAAAVRDAEPILRRLLGEDRALIVAAEADPRVWVDPVQLQQVVINLALNARDAMPSGGKLFVTTAEVAIEASRAAVGGVAIPVGRHAVLRMRDTGVGMEEALQTRIFEPFFTTKPVGQGTGLGLAATHGVLTQNHGYITVTSAPGQGATFCVYLPITPVAETLERPEASPSVGARAAHAGATVLVVDDEPGVRTVAARILSRAGLRVLQAEGGKDALAMVERHGPPHLVLTDLMMPGIGGVELARRLKARWPALPILFMSGYSAEDLRRQDAIVSADDLIEKPFGSETLLLRVAAALS